MLKRLELVRMQGGDEVSDELALNDENVLEGTS